MRMEDVELRGGRMRMEDREDVLEEGRVRREGKVGRGSEGWRGRKPA